jgi:hypothetical protein
MEVEAMEKKGHRAFAKAIKSFGSSERHKRSKSDLEDMCAKDALYASDKTCVQPKPDAVKVKVKSDINAEVQPGRGAQSFLRKEVMSVKFYFSSLILSPTCPFWT